MADKKLFTPGEKAPASGQYKIVGPRGGDKGGFERTIVMKDPFPPTPEKGFKYELIDRTKNGAGNPQK